MCLGTRHTGKELLGSANSVTRIVFVAKLLVKCPNFILHTGNSRCGFPMNPILQFVYVSDRLCGLVVRVLGYVTEVYCVSCEVRTEFIYVM
jgi:hypothetical protein